MRRQLVAMLLTSALVSVAAYATVLTGQDMEVIMQSTEKLTMGCKFVGRTAVSSAMTTTLLRGTDASPSNIITASSCSGDTCSWTVYPTNRHGRQYQVTCLMTDTNGDKIACDVLVVVRNVVYQPDVN
jgi:hypothetical protein